MDSTPDNPHTLAPTLCQYLPMPPLHPAFNTRLTTFVVDHPNYRLIAVVPHCDHHGVIHGVYLIALRRDWS